MTEYISRALVAAVERRAALARDPATTAYRLVNGAADGLSGVTIDRFGPTLVLNLYAGAAPRRERVLIEILAALPGIESIYVKRRPRNPARLSAGEISALAPSHPIWGKSLTEVVVSEGGLRFLVRPGDGLSTGLFLDMRETRARLRARMQGRTVLNLFAYTCAFGVAAVSGGARRVLNVDASRPALEWGRRNYALNECASDPHDFVYGDALNWLERLARRGSGFDVVITDPPSYSTVKGRRFTVARDYGALAGACARVTAPGGELLLCANEARMSPRTFRLSCLDGVTKTGRAADVISFSGAPAVDFPTVPGSAGHLKILRLRVKDR